MSTVEGSFSASATIKRVGFPVLLARDAFERTVSNGFGTADVGGDYTVTTGSASDASVGSGVGTIAAGDWTEVALSEVPGTDFHYRAKVSITGGPNIAGIVVCRVVGVSYAFVGLWVNASNEARAYYTSHLSSTNSASLGTYVSGEWWWVDAFINPSYIRVKAWRDGDPEPTGWALDGEIASELPFRAGGLHNNEKNYSSAIDELTVFGSATFAANARIKPAPASFPALAAIRGVPYPGGVSNVFEQSRRTFSKIEIFYNGIDLVARDLVKFSKTSFELAASAQPGTATVALKTPSPQAVAFVNDLGIGKDLYCKIDGITVWRGFGTQIVRGYEFPDAKVPTMTIMGVDLNILFDRLVIYNHANPNKWPTGDGTYVKANTGLLDGGVPQGTSDRDFLINSLKDTEAASLGLLTNWIKEIGSYTADGPGNTRSAGSTIRALFEDVSGVSVSSQPGSVVWYIEPTKHFVYTDIDSFTAPFSVSDDGSLDVACRELTITTDISNIKNDVLVFAGSLDPRPGATQQYLYYSHKTSPSSISTYGRFQYTEMLSQWSKAAVSARASKIIFQEGTPAKRASFAVFRPGLLPGQIMTLAATEFGQTFNIPVRTVRTTFPTPNFARFDVTASFDTNDPWGLLLALKRPPSRGLVPPRMQSITLQPGQDPPHVLPFTHVEEVPEGLGGNIYQCSYGYVRYSLVVYVAGRHQNRFDETASETAETGYIETDPSHGKFKFVNKQDGTVWVAYHVSQNL